MVSELSLSVVLSLILGDCGAGMGFLTFTRKSDMAVLWFAEGLDSDGQRESPCQPFVAGSRSDCLLRSRTMKR